MTEIPPQRGNNIHCNGVHFWWTRPGDSTHNQVPVMCTEYVAGLERALGIEKTRAVRHSIFRRLDAQYRETSEPTSKSDTPTKWCSMCKVRRPRHEESRFCKNCYADLIGANHTESEN